MRVKLLQNLICYPVLFFKRSTVRPTPPKCMLVASLGKLENVRANGINFHCVISGDDSKPLMLLLHGYPEVDNCCDWLVTPCRAAFRIWFRVWGGNEAAMAV